MAIGTPVRRRALVRRRTSIARSPGLRARQRRRTATAYLFLAPWLVGLVVFTVYPIAASGYFSMTEYNVLTPPKWTGLENYQEMLQDELFWKSLRVTLLYCLVVVPGTVVVGYLMALLLHQKVRGMAFWRTVFYLPAVVPIIATAYLWSWILNPKAGLINALLARIGIDGPDWFGSETAVVPAYMMMGLWTAGAGVILYLAALQQVPDQLYEAAKLDGAGSIRRLWHITLPMTSPVILFTTLTGLIASFQIFTAAYVLTKGGPNNASLFYILYLYRNGWQYFNMGYASALAWVLFVIMLLLTILTLRIGKRFVYYETPGD